MISENLAKMDSAMRKECVYAEYDIKGSTNNRKRYKVQQDLED